MITIVGYVSAFKYFHTKQEEKKQFSEEIELALSQLVAGYARETAELQRRNEMRSQEGISIKYANEKKTSFIIRILFLFWYCVSY
jgi:hypothetical protein